MSAATCARSGSFLTGRVARGSASLGARAELFQSVDRARAPAAPAAPVRCGALRCEGTR